MVGTTTPDEEARSWAANLEAAPGVMRSDLEVMVIEETGRNRPQAHAAVLDATEDRSDGSWQVQGPPGPRGGSCKGRWPTGHRAPTAGEEICK
ncbi:MAG TPA: hypothetical protein VNH82_04755 [Candidatus Dormibacteraeota bacterium]|nr:hypothetical protein [Candidatus Dormibacteraeota bacterium]